MIQAAGALLSEAGWDGLTVPELARRLGVRPGSIYWYFPTRDDVAAAVFDQALDDTLTHLPTGPPQRRLSVFLTSLERYRDLAPVVHERMSASEALAVFHGRLHDAIESLLDAVVPADVPRRSLVLATARACIEGTALHPDAPYSLEDMLGVVLRGSGAGDSVLAVPHPDDLASEGPPSADDE